jgi:hypothetical protein
LSKGSFFLCSGTTTLFDFKPTDVVTVSKLVNKINIKKATGVDQISSKLLRADAPVLNKHITTLVNNTIKTRRIKKYEK